MLRSFESRVRDIIEDHDQGRWPLTRAMLQMAATFYGVVVRSRVYLFEKGILSTYRLPCKVIAIGNLTTGGTGKTPMTIYIARLLQKMGKRVVVISRGYKGAAEKKGGLVSDDRRILMTPDQAGDEPYMMAHQLPGIPVLVGRDRYRSGRQAVRQFQPDVILLDDGYQHLRLHRDLNVLLLDARRPFGNGHLLPRGKLREPIAAAQRADVAIFTRCQGMDKLPALLNLFPGGVPTFHAVHQPIFYRVDPSKENNLESVSSRLVPIATEPIAGKTAYAFSGIADNEQFKQTLITAGVQLSEFRSFADHYQYSEADLEEIAIAKELLKVHFLATTEKDFYRIQNRPAMMPLIVASIKIAFIGDPPDFRSVLGL